MAEWGAHIAGSGGFGESGVCVVLCGQISGAPALVLDLGDAARLSR
jgi:hypothetical protein